MIWGLSGAGLWADTFKVATFNTELSRRGPGVLLRDILKGEDAQINAVISEITAVKPDVIALQGFDYDLENRALAAFADALSRAGHPLAYAYAGPPNAGRQTPLDLDGDGHVGGPGDAQGYGRFFGAGSMAILSRYPILHQDIEDYAAFLWRDLPGALLPQIDGAPYPSAEALQIQRLSSHGHWVVPVAHPVFGTVSLLTYHATPPVFDGTEDRNGQRNHDETAFWLHYLDGTLNGGAPGSLVLLGDANLDPDKGDGRGEVMQRLLTHKALSDPLPDQTTVSWPQTGPMRVDYVLPSTDWQVQDAGLRPINPVASRHSLVWVTLTR